jgi:hypothetical protein
VSIVSWQALTRDAAAVFGSAAFAPKAAAFAALMKRRG